MKSLRQLDRKKLTLDEISHFYKIDQYPTLYEVVTNDLALGIIRPIKSSGLNGKKPALYKAYKVVPMEKDYSHYEEEIAYKISTRMDMAYYRKNLTQYEKDRQPLLQLSQYLEDEREALKEAISLNERSFEIWGREKYLKQEGGKRLLKNVGMCVEDLGVYEAAQPIAYYAHHKKVPQNVLIIENMDTFYTMRKYLIEGSSKILGVPIGSLIYGGGKGICKSFRDFSYGVEPYLTHPDNTLLYFGDLDYEGIGIYESLEAAFREQYPIIPFKEAYEQMLMKWDKLKEKGITLPLTKEGQNKQMSGYFLSFFEEDVKKQIGLILEADCYIPQELLNAKDLSEKITQD